MIITHNGNLLENVKTGIIVHGCNSKGVMGAGFAKAVKALYPDAYTEYKELCDGESYYGIDTLGKIATTPINDDLYVISAITQKDFGRENKRYVDYDAVEECFHSICKTVYEIAEYRAFRLGQVQNIVTSYEVLPPVHFPMIGAGLGGGDWNIISEIIDRTLPDPVSKNLWTL